MLHTAFATQKNEPAKQAFVRHGTCSSIVSAREDVAGDEHALLLNGQQSVDHDADLQRDFKKRAGTHIYLESWSMLTRHGGQ